MSAARRSATRPRPAGWIGGLAVAASLVGCAGDPPRVAPEDVAAIPDAPLARAVALAKAGRDEEALRIALGIGGADAPPSDRETALFLAAECRYRLGFLDEAAATYQELVDAFPASRALPVVPRRLLAIGVALRDVKTVTLLGVIDERARAIEVLSRVVVDYPGSDVADDAWMEIARTHLDDGQPELAALAYERLLRDHPRSDRAEEARYLAVLAWRACTRGADYDVEPMLMARQAGVRYLRRHGRGGWHADEVVAALQVLNRELAESERAIADFYERRGWTDGAALHDGNADELLGVAAAERTAGLPRSTDNLRPSASRPPWDAGAGTLRPLLVD